MGTRTRCGLAAAALVAAGHGAVAAGPSTAQMQPDPNGALSVFHPGEAAGVPVEEKLVRTPSGILRVRVGPGEAEAGPAVPGDASGAKTVRNARGQAMRVRPDVLPDATAGAEPGGLPQGAVIVGGPGGVKVLRMPGTLGDRLQAAPAASGQSLPPGVRVVELRPGAVMPDGMPEPMTLYRFGPAVPARAAQGDGR